MADLRIIKDIKDVNKRIDNIKIPTSLPANGGNADSVGGIQAKDLYHTNNKPTKADIGLSNVPNYPVTGSVADASNEKLATAGAVKQAYDKAVEALNAVGAVKGAVPSDRVQTTVFTEFTAIASGDGYLTLGYFVPKQSGYVKIQFTMKNPSSSTIMYAFTPPYNKSAGGSNMAEFLRTRYNLFAARGTHINWIPNTNQCFNETFGTSSSERMCQYYIPVTKGTSVALGIRHLGGNPAIVKNLQICYDEVSA